MNSSYVMAPGSQVRDEDFGLLFYTMSGPRLYFISSGNLLDSGFFNGKQTLAQQMEAHSEPVTEKQITNLKHTLNQLKEKGVILEC